MAKQLIKLDTIARSPYVGLLLGVYKDGDKIIDYDYITRRPLDKTTIKANNHSTVDAVKALTYFIKDNEIYLILIKQFRYTINDYIFEFPAGLVEPNEAADVAISRELNEEIGGTIKSIKLLAPNSYTGVGMSDETCQFYEAEVAINDVQHLDENEEISIYNIALKDIMQFLNNNMVDAQSRLMALNFYNEQKVIKLENELKNAKK